MKYDIRDIGTRIGEDFFKEGQKFVLSLEGDCLVYVAGDTEHMEPLHQVIAETAGLTQVLGGGHLWVKQQELIFFDRSGTYGGVPPEVMRSLAQPLLEKYRTLKEDIATVAVFTQADRETYQKWQSVLKKLPFETG
ncbi:hypothetical protein C4573_04440 [Candidatus Woesearchaeota archaeon]|nr:MAG: hypothetical protein C4573_04440 [Candidatus Woesearchaeota archaeon]